MHDCMSMLRLLACPTFLHVTAEHALKHGTCSSQHSLVHMEFLALHHDHSIREQVTAGPQPQLKVYQTIVPCMTSVSLWLHGEDVHVLHIAYRAQRVAIT